MNDDEKCPKCGSEVVHRAKTFYECGCGSLFSNNGTNIDTSPICAQREVTNLRARIAELEAINHKLMQRQMQEKYPNV